MRDRSLRTGTMHRVTAEPDAPTVPAMQPPGSEPGDAATHPAMPAPEDEVAYSDPRPPVVEVEPDPAAPRRLNLLFVATSLTVLLVTVERFSFTTEILLRPANFLRLHEAVQLTVIILATVLVQAGLLWAVSHRFSTLTVPTALLFIAGIYFTATGNGVHELGSFTYQTYCHPDRLGADPLCGGLYINDFYTGNAMFFAGALMTTSALLVLERRAPQGAGFSTGALAVAVVNALVYALAVVAYAAFDQVLVGFAFTVVMAFVGIAYLSTTGRDWRRYPFTVYTSVTFVLGAAVAAVVRQFVTGWPLLSLH
jgi:hypothetical protein